MSNENFIYGLPYSSVRPHRQAPQATQAGNYQAHNISSSGPYYGPKATAAAAATYGAPEYRSERYSQQRPSNGGADFNWYGNADPGQRTDFMGSDNIREEQPEASTRSNSQVVYDGSSLGSYACNSTLNYVSNHGTVHAQPAETSNQGAHGGRTGSEDINVRIPYQPYSRNFEQSGVGSAGSSSSQQGIERRAPVEQASGIRPYMSLSQTAMNSTTAVNSYSSYPSSTAVPRSNVSSAENRSDSVESLVRHKPQNSSSSQYGFERNGTPGLERFQVPRTQGTPTPPPVAQIRTRQAATRITERQKTKTPPLLRVPQPASSLPQPTGPQYTNPPRAHPLSTSTNHANTTQPNPQSQLEHTFTVPQGSQSYNRYPLVSEYHNASSVYRSQTQENDTSAVSQDPLVSLRPPSPSVPTTVDPSHVYNRYHEYQKQIEAADAEHARLAALKAEREAAEAAAAALASAKSISQTKTPPRSQLENERAHEFGRQSEMQSHSVPNSSIPSNLASTDQAADQNVPETQSTILDPQRQLPARNSQVAAMEEEMRLMVEKMREYQSQDPQLFAHVWESVKKMQAPRPMQAQIRAGDDLIRTSIESQNKQLPKSISTSAQQTPPPVRRSEPKEVTNPPAKPPRKRKSRSKTALEEQAMEKSQRLPVREGERAGADVAPTAVNDSNSSISLQQQAQKGPEHTNREAQRHTSTSAKPSSLLLYQHTESPDSPQGQVSVNGISDRNTLENPAQSKQTLLITAAHTPVDPALFKQSSQLVQAPVAVMNKNAPNMAPTDPGVSPRSAGKGQSKAGVLWPEEYKDAIANTAAKVLASIPENAEKNIGAFQILDMLGYNPNYIELCELIEDIGFKLDRARLATALLAAIPAVNSTPAQPAESKVPQISNKSATFKEYQPFRRGFSNATEKPSSIEQADSGSGRAACLPVEATAPVSAPPRHSESVLDNTKPISKGPGSRGPYRKTRERILEVQNSPSSSERRREPGRPKNRRLPRVKGVSNITIDPPRDIAQNPEAQPTMQSASQAALKASLNSRSDNIEDRLVLALTGRVARNPDLALISSNVITIQPAVVSTEPASEPRPPNSHPSGHSTRGWRSYALSSPPTNVVNGDVNGGPTVATATLPPTPLTKERAARKRTFAEIIDLTSEDIPASVEDHPLIVSKVRRLGDTNFQSADGCGGTQEPKMQNASLEHQSHLAITTTPVSKPSQSHRPDSSTLAIVPVVPNPYEDFEDIVKPIDRSVALRKSRYDPKTIAYDILIATARHPFQRGLNAHLETLKARFARVDNSSDLSTFRWDIVDPGGPPAGSANMSPLSEEWRNKSSTGADNSSSSRVVLDGVTLPVGRGPLRPTRGGGSIRGRGRPSLLQTKTVTPAQPSGLRFSSTVESNFAVVIESTAPEKSHDPGQPRYGRLERIDSASPARRRGRPLKNHSAISQPVTAFPKRIGRPPKALSSGIGMRGNSAGRKVGRPRMYPLSESKPTGRPRKSNPKPVTPKFIPFLCEWKDCKAELHNLETLRRHVYSVHPKVQESGAIACRWSKCGLNRQVHDKSTPSSTPKSTPEPKFVHEPHEFAGMMEFKDHMERIHLIPFAWHMGDGPRGSTLDGSESDASAYLSDAAGNQVTPSIASQVIEGGNAKINNARRVAQQKRLYDPALESPAELATPGMRAKFFMGTEWKRIKAPRRDDRDFD